MLGTNTSEFQPDKELNQNGPLNQEVSNFFSILAKLRNRPGYWKVANELIGSLAYLIMCFNNVLPRWYKTMALDKCLAILHNCITMSKSLYSYRVISIPKPNSEEMRPLSVASPEWRILQHQLMHILQLWFCDYIPINQHGFQPGKGTATAWSNLLTKVLPSANIYEFDLSKFFDSVNLDYLLRLLKAALTPPLGGEGRSTIQSSKPNSRLEPNSPYVASSRRRTRRSSNMAIRRTKGSHLDLP